MTVENSKKTSGNYCDRTDHCNYDSLAHTTGTGNAGAGDKISIRTAVAYWFGTVGYMCLIFFLSSRTIDAPELPVNFDKVIHMIMYFFLAVMLSLSLRKSGMKRYVFMWALVLASVYGITDEIHQSFIPGRNSDIYDAVADIAGALIGCISSRFLRI